MSDISNLKQKYEELKKKSANAEAKRDLLLGDLKKRGLNSVDEALARIDSLTAESEKVRERINKQVTLIQETLDANG